MFRKFWLSLVLVACSVFIPDVAGQLFVNELMADNTSTDYDDFFESEDWVEIYNSGGIVNLAGYYLSDDPDSLDKWMFPNTNPAITTILPGGHLRIWCDKDPNQGEDHADFKLSQDGEGVYLVAPDGTSVIDQITFGPQASNISFGRSCDGCNDWIYFDQPTPEQPNSFVQPETQLLFFNEFQHLNASTIAPEFGPGGAWVEVYNPNPIDVNAANYTIEAGVGNVWTIPSSDPIKTVIPAEGFLLFWLSGEPSWGVDHASFYVGETAPPVDWMLIGPDGTVVDEAQWLGTGVDESYGRSSDGGPLWQLFEQPTPQVSNQILLLPGEPLVINELLSDNVLSITDDANEHDDWFEIHNPTSQPVDLAGYYISDQWNNPTKYRVPSGIPDSTVIPAGGFKLFWADEDQNQGWNHVNFRLSNSGEHLVLRSPDGFTVIDSLNFPIVFTDFSYGRLNDAALPWVFFEETTPGASNNGATTEIIEAFVGLFCFPNPCLRGQTVQINQPVKIYNTIGMEMLNMSSGSSFTAPHDPGFYVIQPLGEPGGMPIKLLVR